MMRPSRKSSRACRLETLPFGNMRSFPCTRPTLISCLSKTSRRSAPPFSLMTIANMPGWCWPWKQVGSQAPTREYTRSSAACQPRRGLPSSIYLVDRLRDRVARRDLATNGFGRVAAIFHFRGNQLEQLARQRHHFLRAVAFGSQLAVDGLRQDCERSRVTRTLGDIERQSH